MTTTPTTTTPTTTTPQITTVTPAEADNAIAVLMLAFSSDPANRWAWPDPRQYITSFPSFVRAFAGQSFELGTAYTIGDYAGAALWLPPDVHPDEDALVTMVQQTVAEQDHETVFGVFEQMGAYHPTEPHWYLPLIGVDPVYHGKGYGSELMKHVLATCDRDGMLAYLESSNPRNITLYERLGFVALGAIQAGASPTLVPMLRTPR